MIPRYLVTGDPISKMQPLYDTSLLLMGELIERGIAVDYCDLFQLDAHAPTPGYLKSLRVKPVTHADAEAANFIGLGPSRIASIDEYQVVLNRKDPPVDDFYRLHAAHMAKAPASILQINNPAVTPLHSEHELPLSFMDFAIPTTVCESLEAFVKAVRSQVPEAVAKPMNECSGRGIVFFAPDVDENELKNYWETWKPTVIVQPFLEEVMKSGDLRILVFNRKVMGSVLRVPKKGSRLANLHQGASGRAFEPTPRQLEATRVVANKLTPIGLYLLGLDFIGDQLSEVNITSPSAVRQINEAMGKRIQVDLVDEIEKLRLNFTQ